MDTPSSPNPAYNTNPTGTANLPGGVAAPVFSTTPPLDRIARPPALPPERRHQGAFADDYAAIPGKLTAHSLIERLLKAPGAVAFELTEGRRLSAGLGLLIIAALCFLSYGFIIGTFSAGEQLLIVPVKVLGGVLFSAAICFPSLYISSCFSGGRQSLGDTIGLFVLGLAMWSVLLVGFAPIAWLFSQSTETVAFMGLLHIIFWTIAACFGLKLLSEGLEHINGRNLGILRVWGVIFLVVTMQVATMLRPLIGKSAPLQLNEKKFFLAHWSDCINGKDGNRK